MKENEKKAYDFASDTTKQLITLATGIIALTITFSKDIIGASKLTNSSLIFWSWGLFILSIFSGIWTLMALTGNLQPMKAISKEITTENDHINNNTTSNTNQPDCLDINTKNVKIPSVIQILSFITGLILTVIFGATSISNSKDSSANDIKDKIELIRKTEYKMVYPSKSEKIIYSTE